MPARPPRIVQVIPSFRLGGTENVVVRLVGHLAGAAEQLVLTPGPTGPLVERFPAGVTTVAMADRHRPDRWNAVRMAAVFRRFRPDVVHARNWTCIDAVVGARLAGVPVVIHGEHGREAKDPDGRNPVRRRVRRWLAPMVTRFVTVSRDLARWLIEDVRVPASKVTQIYNGVDVERFAPGDRLAARAAAGLPADAVIVGTVGRLDPVKDHDGLLEAFARATRARAGAAPALHLAIAGDGPTRAAIAARVASLELGDRVHLLGERDDVPALLRALDVFVLSSIGEGISNAILEAMASGLPVLATRVGGNGELVEDGATGTLVPARDPEALGAALAAYAAEPERRRAHAQAGRERAVGEFSLARMLDRYVALYARAGVALERTAVGG